MERIVIEVDDATGKKWSLVPAKFKKEVSEKISDSSHFKRCWFYK